MRIAKTYKVDAMASKKILMDGRGRNPGSTSLNPAWVSRTFKFRIGPSIEQTKKMRETKKLNPFHPTEEQNRKKGETVRNRHKKFGFTEKEKLKGIKISRTKMGHEVSDETKEKLRIAGKLQWSRDYSRMVKAVFHTRRPNKLETRFGNFLQINFPNEWKYVGDGQVWLGKRCPDFININGKKQLIELFGNYWHKPEDEEIRKAHFKKFGFNTTVVWESELKDEKNLLAKLSIKGGDAQWPGYDNAQILR